MLALPPVAPTVGWSNRIRLGGTTTSASTATTTPSTPPRSAGWSTVTADLERVRVRLDGRLVADHARVWARQMTVTDPAHLAAAQRLRDNVTRPTRRDDDVVVVRDLTDYDRAFGLIDGQVA